MSAERTAELKADSILATIADTVCEDEGTMAAYDKWTDDVELWVLMPFVPRPGKNEGWEYLLKKVATGSRKVKFPRELAEKLAPWIPENYRTAVTAK